MAIPRTQKRTPQELQLLGGLVCFTADSNRWVVSAVGIFPKYRSALLIVTKSYVIVTVTKGDDDHP